MVVDAILPCPAGVYRCVSSLFRAGERHAKIFPPPQFSSGRALGCFSGRRLPTCRGVDSCPEVALAPQRPGCSHSSGNAVCCRHTHDTLRARRAHAQNRNASFECVENPGTEHVFPWVRMRL